MSEPYPVYVPIFKPFSPQCCVILHDIAHLLQVYAVCVKYGQYDNTVTLRFSFLFFFFPVVIFFIIIIYILYSTEASVRIKTSGVHMIKFLGAELSYL